MRALRTRLRYGDHFIRFRVPSSLVENAGREVDLSILQFLRRAIRNFPIHPQGESFDLTPALRELTEGLYPTGRVFAPNRIITTKAV
jgi:hypothetical protein